MSISDMRYQHLVSEAGTLLAELRSLGATFEDCKRAEQLLECSDPSTIGRVIHDLQSQVHDLELSNRDAGIDSNYFEEECEDLYGNRSATNRY